MSFFLNRHAARSDKGRSDLWELRCVVVFYEYAHGRKTVRAATRIGYTLGVAAVLKGRTRIGTALPRRTTPPGGAIRRLLRVGLDRGTAKQGRLADHAGRRPSGILIEGRMGGALNSGAALGQPWPQAPGAGRGAGGTRLFALVALAGLANSQWKQLRAGRRAALPPCAFPGSPDAGQGEFSCDMVAWRYLSARWPPVAFIAIAAPMGVRCCEVSPRSIPFRRHASARPTEGGGLLSKRLGFSPDSRVIGLPGAGLRFKKIESHRAARLKTLFARSPAQDWRFVVSGGRGR